MAQGAAAAARVLGMITKGTVMIEPIVASIDEEACSGCRICNNMCPYNAIEFDDEQGGQPRDHGAVQGLRHVRGRLPGRRRSPGPTSTTQQIFAEIEGILWDAIAGERPARHGRRNADSGRGAER